MSADGQTAWRPSPRRAALIRFLALLLPVVAAVIASSVAASIIGRPAGLALRLAWWVAIIAIGVAAATLARPVMQRLVPIGYVYRLGLTFPDHAPNRFSLAVRRTPTRELARRVAAGEPIGNTPQEAAEHMVALLSRLTVHDRLTRGHCERVAAYSHMIGDDLGLSRDDLERLRWAAVIHDVGKLAVPEELLNKDQVPSAMEWRELRQHPVAAAGLIEPLRPWLGPWTDAATQHHERWDGSGYPAGLSGNGISAAARIVAVADAFDVMTSRRSYKRPEPADAARRELAKGAGTQFDPRVVRAFLGVSVGHVATVIGPLAWLSNHHRLSDMATRLRVGTEHAIGAAAFGGAAAALAVASFGAPNVSTVSDLAGPALDAVEILTPGSFSDPIEEGQGLAAEDTDSDTDVDGTPGAVDLPAATPAESAGEADGEGRSELDGSNGSTQPTTTRPDATIGVAPSTTAPAAVAPTPTTVPTATAGGDTEGAGGYRVINDVDLLLADSGWGLASDDVVHLIAEGDPITLDAALTLDGSDGERTELAAGARVCSYLVQAERRTGAGLFVFEMFVSAEIIALATSSADLDATSMFARDDVDITLGQLEGGDELTVDSAGPSRSVLRGEFSAEAGTDTDSLRFFVGC